MFERYPDPHETLLHKLEAGKNREPHFGILSLDTKNQLVCAGEECVRLTRFEYQTLWLLVRAQGNPVNVDEIEQFLYEEQDDDKDLPLHNPTEVRLSRLRKKVSELSKGRMRISHRFGFGYFLEMSEDGLKIA